MKMFSSKIILIALSLLAVMLLVISCAPSEEKLKTELDQLSDEDLNALVQESGTESGALAGQALYNKYAQKNVWAVAKTMQEAKGTCSEWVCDETGKKKKCTESGYSISCGQGKECIDGNCIPALANPCGDGYLHPNEDCDDGGQKNNDGCSSTCKFEVCGDGIIQTNSWSSFKQGKATIPAHKGEFCDDGADNGKPNKCNQKCSGITAPICGNKVVESGEICDDGNNNQGDGCNNCKVEGGWECEKDGCKVCAISLKGLTYWWPADGNAKDFKGGKDGDAGSGTTFSSGKLGPAFNFNNVNNGYVYVKNADSLNLGDNIHDFSIEAWIKLSTGGKILSKMGGSPTNGYELSMTDSGQIRMALVNLAGSSAEGKLQTKTLSDGYLNEWHHVVVVYTATPMPGGYCSSPSTEDPKLMIYVDGAWKSDKAEVVGAGNACLVTTNDAGLFIGPGVGSASTPFKGLIDEVGIYNYALSETEIKELYEAGNAGKKRCKK